MIKCVAIFLMSIMFLWSGLDKIVKFQKKVSVLAKKTGLPSSISSIGMFLVILLETFGFIILLEYYCNKYILSKFIHPFIPPKQLVKYILVSILIFLVVVTFIYHPLDLNKPIPFLSNLTTFGAFLYLYGNTVNCK
jgi:hypothetical protein